MTRPCLVLSSPVLENKINLLGSLLSTVLSMHELQCLTTLHHKILLVITTTALIKLRVRQGIVCGITDDEVYRQIKLLLDSAAALHATQYGKCLLRTWASPKMLRGQYTSPLIFCWALQRIFGDNGVHLFSFLRDDNGDRDLLKKIKIIGIRSFLH